MGYSECILKASVMKSPPWRFFPLWGNAAKKPCWYLILGPWFELKLNTDKHFGYLVNWSITFPQKKILFQEKWNAPAFLPVPFLISYSLISLLANTDIQGHLVQRAKQQQSWEFMGSYFLVVNRIFGLWC